jgi:uracil-DNA glycosylase
VHVIVCLGAFAWDGVWRGLKHLGQAGGPRPAFGHGAEAAGGSYTLLGCYHPSQQNTFTGKLTAAMIDAVFTRARTLADKRGEGAVR